MLSWSEQGDSKRDLLRAKLNILGFEAHGIAVAALCYCGVKAAIENTSVSTLVF